MEQDDSQHQAYRLTGERLGKFVILSELGRGSMGVVYEALQEDLKRKVALKILPANIALDAKQVRRFRREAESAAKLHHDNIIPIFEVGEIDNTHYFTMALIDGRHFGAVGRRDRAWIMEASRITRDAARGLAHAHENNVIHRDIKPSNLILDRSGRVFVTDFGLARLTESASLTSTDAIVGTPKYMSPEQILPGQRVLDGRADIYSLGATLYEVITGRPPIDAPSVQAFISAVLEDRPPNPRKFNREIPHDLATIILRCLEKDPDDRYAKMGDLADDLDRFLAGERIRAKPKGSLALAYEVLRRHRVISALSALSLIAVVALLLVMGRSTQVERDLDLQTEIAGIEQEKDEDLAIERAETLLKRAPARPEVEAALRNAYLRRANSILNADQLDAERALADLQRAGQAGTLWHLMMLLETSRFDEARAEAERLGDSDPARIVTLARLDIENHAYEQAIRRLGEPGEDSHAFHLLTRAVARRGLALQRRGEDAAEAEKLLREAEADLSDAARRSMNSSQIWLRTRIQVLQREIRGMLGYESNITDLAGAFGGVAQEAMRNLTAFWTRMTQGEAGNARDFVLRVLNLAGERAETLPVVLERSARQRLATTREAAEVVKANLLLAVAQMSAGTPQEAEAALQQAEDMNLAALMPYIYWGKSLLSRSEEDLAKALEWGALAIESALGSPGSLEPRPLIRNLLLLWEEAVKRNDREQARIAASYAEDLLKRRPELAEGFREPFDRLRAFASPSTPPR